MAFVSQVENDVTALAEIGVMAWEKVDQTSGIPAGAKGVIAGAILEILGTAYLKNRAGYQRDPLPPGSSPQPER